MDEIEPDVLVAGIDIGSVATKTAIISNGGLIVGHDITPKGAMYKDSAELSFANALQQAGLAEKDISYIVSTGYGRARASFAHFRPTEIICHARGVRSQFPRCRTVVDIGGQDSKAIALNESGQVKNFRMNDRCAAGTGRWLESMAHVLGVDLDKMGPLALASKKEIQISSMCTVFAESEVISYMAQGASLEDVLEGVHRAVVERVVQSLVWRVGITRDVVLTGGGAKNVAIKRDLERAIDVPVLVPEEPQLTGALGAALIGLEKVAGEARSDQITTTANAEQET